MHEQSRCEETLARLEALGLVVRGARGCRTTRKWQAAMARAALSLYRAGDASEDLRVPVAAAMVEFLGERVDSGEIASAVEAMLPIEARGGPARPHG